MEWTLLRRIRRQADASGRRSALGLESLEPRQLLAASQDDGREAVSGSLTAAPTVAPTTEQITWDGRLVEARAERWNGRLVDRSPTPAAFESLRFPGAGWTASSLGDGFFSLTTPGSGRADVLAWAARTPGLLTIEPDIVLQASWVPNDPGFASQWNLSNTAVGGYGLPGADLHATMAWNVTAGSRNVVVAVIDSGIDLRHPDLAANVWTNPGEIAGNGIDDDNNGFIDDVHGWNFAGNNNDVQDGYGHGTHVAGIIGAVGNNGLGVTGIAWRVSILPLRFQDAFGAGHTGGAIAALNYATMMRRDFGINIVVSNNSWGGGTGISELLHEAIQAHADAGITFVAAAGNSGANCDTSPRYPACFDLPNVISVAATDRYDTLAGFSNYGAGSIDLGAPGVGIYSTRLGGGYGFMSGTSQAAPHVAGVVALLAALKPGITVAEVRSAILGSADRVPGLLGRTVTGGRLDAAGALDFMLATAFTARARVSAIRPLTGTVDAVTITFSRPVGSGFDLADLRLTRNGTTIPLDGTTLSTTGPTTWTISGLERLTAPVGSYALGLATSPADSGIADADGESLVFLWKAAWARANRLPVGTIEAASPVTVKGWALDPNAGSRPTAVQLWINGLLVTTVWATATRDGLIASAGSTNHGYAIAMPPLPIGDHTVVVKALDLEAGRFVWIAQRIVAVRPPVGAVDGASTNRVFGWAFSSRAGEAPVKLLVMLNGTLYGSYRADLPRPDLLPVFGSANHGFDIMLNPAAFRLGSNLLRVWAVDPLTGRFTLLGSRTLIR